MSTRNKPDFYALRAKREGYPARSVYKLEEIQQKYRIISPGMKVLDIGASPGSWSLFVLKRLKGAGHLVAVDLESLQLKKSHRNFTFFQGDVFSQEIVNKLQQFAPFNCIISDAAPGTTGNRTIDTGRSYSLVEEIITMAKGLLAEGGNLVVKVFQGGDESQLMDLMRRDFAMVKGLKPKACRKESFETYYVGLQKGME